jgi:uncharacterized protein Yka (UPF0111/DUF47 family)
MRGRRRRGTTFSHPELVRLFAKSGANLQRTAELAHELVMAWPDERELIEEIAGCEHDGDKVTRRIIEELHEGRLPMPDRPRLYGLAGAIDDVVDEIEEACQELAVYGIEGSLEQGAELAGVCRDSARELKRALDGLPEFAAIEAGAPEIRRLEHEGDRIYRQALAALHERGSDPLIVLSWKDILRGFEDAIDRTRQAMDILHGLTLGRA